MDACHAVEKELERVLSKFGAINEHASRILCDLISYIENIKNELDSAPVGHELTPVQADLLKQAMTKVKDTTSRLATDHRDLHSTVSKVGKSIDRNFTADFAVTTRDDIFSEPKKIDLLNQVIYQHFCRLGMLDVANELAKETTIKNETGCSEVFLELNHILECLKKRDLDPAIAWATTNHDKLVALNSSLEFYLHRLKFVQLISKGASHQIEAIQYARTHFGKFIHTHENAIQVLMGMFLYVQSGIANSPYGCYMNNDLWIEIYEVFTRDSCRLLGISIESPLATCVNAGCTAIPALLNIKQVMMQRQVSGIWNAKEELPIEIDLGNAQRYHSMFACPILRQQSTEANPPMRLLCGHVISRDALNKLCNGNKMKCPYCPVEQSPSDARLIFF